MIGDLVIARPLLIGATVLGAAAFVVSLPFTALGGNVGEAGKALVVEPGKAASYAAWAAPPAATTHRIDRHHPHRDWQALSLPDRGAAAVGFASPVHLSARSHLETFFFKILLPLAGVLLLSWSFWASSGWLELCAGLALFLFGMQCLEEWPASAGRQHARATARPQYRDPVQGADVRRQRHHAAAVQHAGIVAHHRLHQYRADQARRRYRHPVRRQPGVHHRHLAAGAGRAERQPESAGLAAAGLGCWPASAATRQGGRAHRARYRLHLSRYRSDQDRLFQLRWHGPVAVRQRADRPVAVRRHRPAPWSCNRATQR